MIFRYVSLSEILNSDVTKVEAFGTIDNWRFIYEASFTDVLCSYEKWGAIDGIGNWYCILILRVLYPFVLFNRAVVVD